MIHARRIIKLAKCIVADSNRRKHFITTPIFYANGPPHIGHLYTALLADCSHRWNLLKYSNGEIGMDTIFSTGTDEHGSKIQRTALAAGYEPLNYCDMISDKFRSLFHIFNIEPTDFIRTTERRHVNLVTEIWKRLQSKGLIHKGRYSGYYSTVDECFYAFDDIEECKIDNRIFSISKKTGSVVEWIDEENYVFPLSKYFPEIKAWLLNKHVLHPSGYVPFVLNYLENEEMLSLSRDSRRISWGIPVPDDPTQTIYVWLDALTNYLTVSGFIDGNSNCVWPPTCQIIGKDIIRFHAVIWPAILMALELPLPDKIFVHSHWLVDGSKMSKSRGNVVDPFKMRYLLSSDGLRYFLLRQATLHSDSNFTLEKAVDVVNTDLVNNIGNLLQRSTIDKFNPSRKYPTYNPNVLLHDLSDHGNSLITSLNSLQENYGNFIDKLSIHKALEALTDVTRDANYFFQYYAPWKLDADSEKVQTILYICYESLRICGILLQPVVPNYANAMLARLGIQKWERNLADCKFEANVHHRDRVLPTNKEPIMRRIDVSKFETFENGKFQS